MKGRCEWHVWWANDVRLCIGFSHGDDQIRTVAYMHVDEPCGVTRDIVSWEASSLVHALNRREIESFTCRCAELSDAPCKCCNYNGPGYYQPVTHKCASLPGRKLE